VFADRFKKLLKALDLSMRQFAKEIGVSPSTFYEYMKGRTPPADIIVRICKRFNVSERWLLTGEGEMFLEKEKPEASPKAQPEDLSPELQKALSHPTIRNIAIMLSEMPEEDIKDILKRVEEKATLKKLLQKVQELERKVSGE